MRFIGKHFLQAKSRIASASNRVKLLCLISIGVGAACVYLFFIQDHQCVRLAGHTDKILFMKFSADGRSLTTVSGDVTAKLWDLQTFTESSTLSGNNGFHWLFATFSPTDRFIATWFNDVRVWDGATGKPVPVKSNEKSMVRRALFATVGNTLAVGYQDGHVELFDLDSKGGPRSLQRQDSGLYEMIFSPNGKMLAITCENPTVEVWDAILCKKLFTINDKQGVVSRIAFAVDGRMLASGNENGSICIWEAATGNQLASFQMPTGPVYSVQFTPDGNCLIGKSPQHVLMLDVTKKSERAVLSFQKDSWFSMLLAPSGKALATSGTNQFLRIWDIETGKMRLAIEDYGMIRHISFSQDSELLAIATDQQIVILDIISGKKLATLSKKGASITCLEFSPNSETLAFGNEHGVVKLWKWGRKR